jgi:hypothetical protein
MGDGVKGVFDLYQPRDRGPSQGPSRHYNRCSTANTQQHNTHDAPFYPPGDQRPRSHPYVNSESSSPPFSFLQFNADRRNCHPFVCRRTSLCLCFCFLQQSTFDRWTRTPWHTQDTRPHKTHIERQSPLPIFPARRSRKRAEESVLVPRLPKRTQRLAVGLLEQGRDARLLGHSIHHSGRRRRRRVGISCVYVDFGRTEAMSVTKRNRMKPAAQDDDDDADVPLGAISSPMKKQRFGPPRNATATQLAIGLVPSVFSAHKLRHSSTFVADTGGPLPRQGR